MALPFDDLFPGTQSSGVKLRNILENCQGELHIVRRRMGYSTVHALQQRLDQVAEHLEQATRVLDRPTGSSAAASSSLAAAELLARETDHRVKNSLQALTSLLLRQADQSKVATLRGALKAASARVSAIAQVHAALQVATERCAAVSGLDLGPYLRGLCDTLGEVFGVDGELRRLQVDVASLKISPSMAQVSRLGGDRTGYQRSSTCFSAKQGRYSADHRRSRR